MNFAHLNNAETVRYFDLLTMVLFGLIGLAIILFLRLKKKKSSVYLLFFTIFYVYLFKVLDYTLFQFQSLVLLEHFAPDLRLRGLGAAQSLNLIPLITLTLKDVRTSLLNILLLMPFGFGLPFITNFRMRKIVLIGALFSITIELLQLVTGLVGKMTFRIADVNDVIFNTIGVIIGCILFVEFVHICRHIFRNRKLASNSILQYILERPQVDNKGVSKKFFVAIIIIIAMATFFGYQAYTNSRLNQGFGVGVGGQVGNLDNQQEGAVPQNGDLCGGTGGTGEIISSGNNTIVIKNKAGVVQTINLTTQTDIRNSAGSISESDLKIGDHITVVVLGEKKIASTVLVCTLSSPETQSEQ